MGVWVGPSKERNQFNERGFFENRELMLLSKKRRKIEWSDVLPILRRQGWNGERWLVKQKAPYWLLWTPLDPIFLKVRRSTEAIVSSRTRKIKRDADLMRQEIGQFVRIMEDQIPGYTVWPERLIEGDDSEFRATWAKLGLQWSCNFLDRSLWHFP